MKLQLQISQFSGLLRSDGALSPYGVLKPFVDLPKKDVRRLSNLERGVVACLMGLNENLENGLGNTPIVLASRYGAMANTLDLLKLINLNETLSPTAFSLSVHNAAVGVASQLTCNQGGHTAISAGKRSLPEGLTECYARLKDGSKSVVLMSSDCHLPDEYAVFGDIIEDVQFAFLLNLVTSDNSSDLSVYHSVEDGMQGIVDCLLAVEHGKRYLSWTV